METIRKFRVLFCKFSLQELGNFFEFFADRKYNNSYNKILYLLTYFLIYLLHGAESFLRS